ncbi:hypothetical protein [uncultured Rhodoblastus sp.]|uniref:hypothetical protein n=1 Tax=uncultured Rhodoblastus sp. TaxID=543037 RepID=UPI0025EA3FD1|nr:hypothetical protein [uncultured Rhodoblastus sp.]
MNNRIALTFGLAVSISSATATFAGPCSQQIGEMQAQIDTKLEAAAAAGPSGKETTAATMNRQPTPKSIAAAEVRLGDISAKTMQAIDGGMARAREADQAGDRIACEKALADVKNALGN